MDQAQTFINWVVGLFGILIGIAIKSVLDSIRELRADQSALTNRVGKVEVLVAGEYVKRDEFLDFCKTVNSKLDEIKDELRGRS